jgi:alpha-ribazole phosphatase
MSWVWRHPRPQGADGRCVGARSDLPVDPRKAKRLAHRLRAHARRHGLPRAVVTSPLRRAADVGRWLRRLGFAWTVDPALAEIDFGAWDGLPWAAIPPARFDAWLQDFAGFDFEGGEPLHRLLDRAGAWAPPPGCALAVSHGGWMLARRWRQTQTERPPQAADWPAAPGYGEAWPLDYRKP